MLKFALLTTFFLAFFEAKSQNEDKLIYVGNVVSDTLSLADQIYPNISPPIQQSTNKIEIRFIGSASFQETTYTIFSYNDIWSATYHYQSTNSIWLSKNLEVNPNDSVFYKLAVNNIFSLPDQDSLSYSTEKYDPETNQIIGHGIGLFHGTSYIIEFKVGDNYRRYRYHNPEIQANFHQHVNELRNFVVIVELFKNWVEK